MFEIGNKMIKVYRRRVEVDPKRFLGFTWRISKKRQVLKYLKINVEWEISLEQCCRPWELLDVVGGSCPVTAANYLYRMVNMER